MANPLAFNPLDGGVTWDDCRKILPGGQRMANLPNGIETLSKIATGCVGRTNVADDRQTTNDRRKEDNKLMCHFLLICFLSSRV